MDFSERENTVNPPIGYVVGGGLEANLQVRLTVPALDELRADFRRRMEGLKKYAVLLKPLSACSLPNRL